MNADSLKPKHVAALVAQWQQDSIGTGTITNRMSALRWWAEKIGKANVVARANSAYGIEERVLVGKGSKAKMLDAELLAKVSDPFTALPLRLEAAFGLRREESIKLMPSRAGPIAATCCGSRIRGPRAASIAKCPFAR